MATYTTNGGIKKIATGDESGTWGTSTNTNFDIIDRLAVGVGSISLSGTTHTLTTSDGSASDGQYHVLVLGGSPSGTNTITVSPNDTARLYVVKNNSGQTATFTQGSGANVSVSNGKSAIIYCDGAGSGAAVVDITATFDTLTNLGITATAAELNYNDITTLGAVEASKTVTADASGNVNWGDSEKAQFGASNDLQIYHDGSNSYIDDTGTGDLKIRGQNAVQLQSTTGETYFQGILNGASSVWYDNNAKLTTSSGGVTVTGTVTCDGISLGDSETIRLGAGDDLQIQHDGSNSIIKDVGTGNLNLWADDFNVLNAAATETKIAASSNGAVTLYYDNIARLATTSSGVDISGGITADSVLNLEAASGYANIEIGGPSGAFIDMKTPFSEDFDARIIYDGSVFDIGTQTAHPTRLKQSNAVKLSTTSTGIDVTGTAVTDGVTVDGTLDIEEVYEKVNLSTGTSGTVTIDTTGYGVDYFTLNQTANRTINFANVNANLGVGQSVTVSVLMTQGSTAYYLNAYQVDGSSVTPKWSGGSAPSAGNASGIDVYTFTIIKTANATFTVLASVTQYA